MPTNKNGIDILSRLSTHKKGAKTGLIVCTSLFLQSIQESPLKTDKPAIMGHSLHITTQLEPVPDIEFGIAVENELYGRCQVYIIPGIVQGSLA